MKGHGGPTRHLLDLCDGGRYLHHRRLRRVRSARAVQDFTIPPVGVCTHLRGGGVGGKGHLSSRGRGCGRRHRRHCRTRASRAASSRLAHLEVVTRCWLTRCDRNRSLETFLNWPSDLFSQWQSLPCKFCSPWPCLPQLGIRSFAFAGRHHGPAPAARRGVAARDARAHQHCVHPRADAQPWCATPARFAASAQFSAEFCPTTIARARPAAGSCAALASAAPQRAWRPAVLQLYTPTRRHMATDVKEEEEDGEGEDGDDDEQSGPRGKATNVYHAIGALCPRRPSGHASRRVASDARGRERFTCAEVERAPQVECATRVAFVRGARLTRAAVSRSARASHVQQHHREHHGPQRQHALLVSRRTTGH